MRRLRLLILGFVVVWCFGGLAANAQVNGSLVYGSAQVGTISGASPLVFYAFPATAGDVIAVNVIALTPGFDPSVSLLNPSQQPIAANDNDPTTPGGLDAHISHRLDATGTYALLIGGVNGTTGDFLVKLNGSSVGNPPSLPAGSAAVIDFTTSPLPQFLAIPVEASTNAALALSADPATFSFSALVFGPDGALIGQVDSLPQASFVIPTAAGTALVIVQPSNPDASGRVQISTGGALPSAANPAGPAATQGPAAVAPAGICTVSSGGTVNLRSGAGTNFPTVGTLNPGAFLAVQGVSPDRGWYAVTTNGQQAWVSATVVSLNGPCSDLPTVQPPAGQVPPTTGAPPTAAGSATGTIEPTADLVAPTQPAASPTAPPTAPPAAPPDNDYQVQLDRNNGGSFSQQISYPEGDRSDRIAVSVSNFDSINTFAQFSVALVCSGTGSEFVRWGENQSQNLACGQNLTLVLTNESNQRFLNVTLPSGSGSALVNYTLVFVKTG